MLKLAASVRDRDVRDMQERHDVDRTDPLSSRSSRQSRVSSSAILRGTYLLDVDYAR